MAAERTPHALAWWGWAAGLAVAALSTTNPVLLAGLGLVALVVGQRCRSSAPWGSAARWFARLAVAVVVIRLAFQVIFGLRSPGTVLFTTPSISLPSWLAGVSVGGPVTLESILGALSQGMRLAVVLLAVGAANAVASPREVLRSMPAVSSEVAVALSVALCFVPEVLAAVRRVRAARHLRGRPASGLAGWRGTAVPVLEDALARSVHLAAAMATRGFGLEGPARPRSQRLAARVLGVGGAALVVLAGYGILTGSGPLPLPAAVAGVGAVLVGAAVWLGPRRARRTRYRPAPFGPRSVLCVASGWASVVVVHLVPEGVHWSPWPLSWPLVSPWAVLGIVLGLAPLLLFAPVAEHRGTQRAEATL
jgi:energy-coupling factor transport system permease protein